MISGKQTEAQSKEHAKAGGAGFKQVAGDSMMPGKPGTMPASGNAVTGPASKGELAKAKKALPPHVVGSMLDDIAKIDPRSARKTGTLGKVGHLTAHAVDATTLGIHHGLSKPLDLAGGATNHTHGDLVPKGQVYVSHEGDPTELPANLLGRAVEDYLVNHGWKPDAAARIAKHLQTPPAGAPPQGMPPQQPPDQQPGSPQGMAGMPPWMTGGGIGQGMPQGGP
jgi:hypothetical protein